MFTKIVRSRVPFYSAYTWKESIVPGRGAAVEVSCGCVGDLVAIGQYKMRLCPSCQERAAKEPADPNE